MVLYYIKQSAKEASVETDDDSEEIRRHMLSFDEHEVSFEYISISLRLSKKLISYNNVNVIEYNN